MVRTKSLSPPNAKHLCAPMTAVKIESRQDFPASLPTPTHNLYQLGQEQRWFIIHFVLCAYLCLASKPEVFSHSLLVYLAIDRHARLVLVVAPSCAPRQTLFPDRDIVGPSLDVWHLAACGVLLFFADGKLFSYNVSLDIISHSLRLLCVFSCFCPRLSWWLSVWINLLMYRYRLCFLHPSAQDRAKPLSRVNLWKWIDCA